MQMAPVENAKIMVVEDHEVNLRLLDATLSMAGYKEVICTSDSRRAVPIFQEFEPDIILLDLHMPYIDGFDLIQQVSQTYNENYVPILVLTADGTVEARERALAGGAADLIHKPFQCPEVLWRVRNLIQMRRLHQQLQDQSRLVRKLGQACERAREEAQVEILERLARMAEDCDHGSGQHAERVADLSFRIAMRLGMPHDHADLLRRASTLHDIGKISIPDSVLLKAGHLTDEEREIMRGHTWAGARLLRRTHSGLIALAEIIALTHHEKWDGSGYPYELAGEDIPLVGRIVALADVFDALYHQRPYKEAWTLEEACAEIKSQSGRHFDPAVVEAFLSLFHDPSCFCKLCAHDCAGVLGMFTP